MKKNAFYEKPLEALFLISIRILLLRFRLLKYLYDEFIKD